MAILLIKDCDATNPLSAKDAMCYKRGDVVQVFADERRVVEKPQPPFVVLKVTGLAVKDATKYMKSVLSEVLTPTGFAQVPTTRREFCVLWDSLPAETLTALRDKRLAEIAWADLRGRLKNKVTGLTEDAR